MMIRKAEPSDFKLIVGLQNQYLDEIGKPKWKDKCAKDLKNILNSEAHTVFVASPVEAGAVGYLIAYATAQIPALRNHPNKKAFYIDTVFVVEGFRQRGVAEELMRSAEEQAKKQELGFVILHSREEVLPFYEGLGFKLSLELIKRV